MTYFWEQRKLETISDVRDGTHDSPQYVQDGHPFITSKNVGNGFINYDDIQYVSDKDYEEINKRSKVDIHDILMGMIGTIGNLALIREKPDFAIKNVALIKHTGIINYKFLYQILQSSYVTNQLLSGMNGGTQKFIALNKIRGLDIPFPTEEEQQIIGTYFENIDHLITLHQCKYRKLANIKKGIFEKNFSKNTNKISFKMFKNTKTWEQRKLTDFVSFFSGLTYTPSDIQENGTLVLRSSNVSDGEIIDADNVYVRTEVVNSENVQEGDIIVVVRNGSRSLIGKHAQIKHFMPNTVIGAFMTGVRSECPSFTNALLNTPHFDEEIAVNMGATINQITGYMFSKMEFRIPSLSEQKKIGSFFDNLDNLITLHQCKVEKLKQIKKTMEDKIFPQINIFRKEFEFMTFKCEADFEEALIKLLSEKGWEKKVIKYPTEENLIENWKEILFENNRGIDRLNNCELTSGEMQQILEEIKKLRTPLKLNTFINGKTVSIKRDNPDDKLHFGKEISLKIYDKREIAAGQTRYQIVQQPQFTRKSKILNDRRGDLMLLINGMPLIHIELKRSGVPVSQAYNQIEKYSKEGIFTGLFSLVQIFVAMTPDETRYFANPGIDGKFNQDYYFHWADFNNEPINDWKKIASSLLSLPMAHQLIGFYTVADESDGVLKVMRSYQYYATNAISDKVAKIKWNEGNQRGGFIWHTTGSGKTMTSFKSAQLIADSKDADKVVFLMDRIELGTQSLEEYRGFAGEKKDITNEESTVKATKNTYTLISKLKSDSHMDTLIVTSIQKMSRIRDEEGGLNSNDIEKINSKRIVFIIDEAHRSTFGDMLITIKNTFPNAIFFGFTGTPIQDENEKKKNTTSTVFGNELHRYSIADGIRDKNVLGFDIYKVTTYKDRDVRRVIALVRAKAKTKEEVDKDPRKLKVYSMYMDPSKVRMAGYIDINGKYKKGIEDYIPTVQYRTSTHQNKVVEDIIDTWGDLTHNSKFHGIFATSSIGEAIIYYRLLKKKMPTLKTTCLVDPNIDNDGKDIQFKEDGLVEIIADYNERYSKDFSLGTYGQLKKDIALRLAHKKHYKNIEREPEKLIDLLIVVDQMLTGFDSKWINTLYLDKILEYENIIQAFSRTNRLFGPEKPFGTIRYYRRPHTMEGYINSAVSLYSGNKPIGLFVDKLDKNLEKMNLIFKDIEELFRNAGIDDFSKLPEERTVVAKFASLFGELNEYLEGAKIQGFKWNKLIYTFKENERIKKEVEVIFDETTYLILVQRYKEIPRGDAVAVEGVPYDLNGYITEIDTGRIDAEYMNSRFEKYLKAISNNENLEQALNELHKSFATLNQEEQKYANIFLHDVQSGDVVIESSKTLREYITEYQFKAKDIQIHKFIEVTGIDEKKLRGMMSLNITENNINEFGRLDELKKSVDKIKIKKYFEEKEGIKLTQIKVNIKTDKLIREFLLKDGFEI